MVSLLLIVSLLSVGVVFLAIELLVLRGVFVVGFVGALAGAGAIWVAYAHLGPSYAGITALGAVVMAGVMFGWLPRTRFARSVSVHGRSEQPANEGLLALVGRQGVAVTSLGPNGSVELDGQIIDVVADGDDIPRGTTVRVLSVDREELVVEPVV